MMMIEESCWESITSWTIINNNNKTTEEEETPPPLELLPARIQKIPNKDYGLIATRTLRKGEIVFGEYAPIGSTIVTKPTIHLAHCSTCLKCMEPSTTFFFFDGDNNGDNSSGGGGGGLPMPHLWPNPNFSNEWMTALEDYSYDAYHNNDQEEEEDGQREAGNSNNAKKHSIMMEDDYGRILCRHCKSMFCSQKCQDDFHKLLLPPQKMDCCCCLYQRLMDRLADIAYEQDDGKSLLADHWEIFLATKLFCTLVTAAATSSSEALKLQNAIKGMCGTSNQITILQAGIPTSSSTEEEEECGAYYTVEPFYNVICDTLALNEKQKLNYPLEFFERLVVIGRRNSVDIQTTPLFTIYNKRLMESCGGNDGSDYKSLLQQIITNQHRSNNNNNHPSTASDLNRFGSIGCCSILPLFSRINHSCQPNLEVRDAGDDGKPCVELIATRDIQQGEELTISYLSDNRLQSNYVARNKRLKSNYLFTCECSRCKNEKERQQEQKKKERQEEEKKETNR